MNKITLQSFNIPLPHVSEKAMPLPTRMVVANATDPSRAMTTPKFSSLQQLQMETPQRVAKSKARDAGSAGSGFNSAHGEEENKANNSVEAVRFKTSVVRESRVSPRKLICHNDNGQRKKNWCKEFTVSSKYQD